MNEGLNLQVLQTTDESWFQAERGWLEETKGMVERGMRQFERKRPEMQRGLSMRQQINAQVTEAKGLKRKAKL